MKQKLIAAVLSFGVFSAAHAQTQIAVAVGEKKPIPIKIKTETACNVEITIAGKKEQRTVEPPNFDLILEFQGAELGATEIRWEGKFRSRGLKSVPACEGNGLIRVTTTPNTEQLKTEWTRLFANLRPDQLDCVKTGLQYKAVKFDSIDPQAILDAPTSTQAAEVFAKCDSFLNTKAIWGAGDPKGFECTVAGGEKSVCTGVFAQKTDDNKLRPIDKEMAIRLHMDGRAWTTAQLETPQGRAERERRVEEQAAIRRESEERARVAKAEADERARVAQLEADERDRKLKASPEYKKQQAELEKKRIAEEKKQQVENERLRIEQVKQEAAQKEAKLRVEKKENYRLTISRCSAVTSVVQMLALKSKRMDIFEKYKSFNAIFSDFGIAEHGNLEAFRNYNESVGEFKRIINMEEDERIKLAQDCMNKLNSGYFQ
jgi:hypothetical protein